MLEALQRLTLSHDLVFLTGGLGPTSDDFTRNVIADCAGKKLIWSEEDWQRIVSRLQTVGAPIAESNKQQAFFPETSQIFPSAHGTASAFQITINNCIVLALPGPPKEITGIWRDHIKPILLAMAPSEKTQLPEVWHCLGQSESKVGELVEDALKGSGLITGYRSHMPYIHVKVWIPKNLRAEFDASWKRELEAALQPWIVGRNDFDAAKSLLEATKNIPGLTVIDTATAGYLASRIFRLEPQQSPITIITTSDSNFKDKASLFLAHISADLSSGSWIITLKSPSGTKHHTEPSRYVGPANTERLRAYVAEKSFIKLAEWLR